MCMDLEGRIQSVLEGAFNDYIHNHGYTLDNVELSRLLAFAGHISSEISKVLRESQGKSNTKTSQSISKNQKI